MSLCGNKYKIIHPQMQKLAAYYRQQLLSIFRRINIDYDDNSGSMHPYTDSFYQLKRKTIHQYFGITPADFSSMLENELKQEVGND